MHALKDELRKEAPDCSASRGHVEDGLGPSSAVGGFSCEANKFIFVKDGWRDTRLFPVAAVDKILDKNSEVILETDALPNFVEGCEIINTVGQRSVRVGDGVSPRSRIARRSQDPGVRARLLDLG
jgi:hypothetical protein